MVELDYTVIVFVFGSVVTSIVGFVVIYNSLRQIKRDARDDLEKQNLALEGRIKDHINYKVEILDHKVDNMNEKVQDINEDIKKKKRQRRGSLNHSETGYEISRLRFPEAGTINPVLKERIIMNE